MIPIEDAIARLAVLPDYDPGGGPGPCVHTFRMPAAGILLGAHWPIDAVRTAMEKFGVEESGPLAAEANHGLVLIDAAGPLFLETK